MLDVKLIRESADAVKAGVSSKNVDPAVVDAFLALDKEWLTLTKTLNEARAEQNRLAANFKTLTDADKERAKALKGEVKAMDERMKELEVKRAAAHRAIPNVPLPHVVKGKSEADNVTAREVGEKPKFAFTPREYTDIAEGLGIIDTARAAKVSGSRFGYLLGAAARLEFAVVQHVLSTLTDRAVIANIIAERKLNIPDTPFVPVVPPVLINRESMAAMGYMDRGEDEIYALPKDDLFLVGTSEQSIGPMHSGEDFTDADLPRRYVGFSTCFRREAGSYGKDTKGILRVHQFDKMEMFSFTHPDASTSEHQLLLGIEEHLMQSLGLPYRVLDICTADLGDPAAAKYDIEAWLPGQNGGKGEYRETHSTSNTTDYQARRLNIGYKPASGPRQYVHMLNGTAFAIGRALLAIMENYQTAEGGIRIPKALQPFMGTDEVKPMK